MSDLRKWKTYRSESRQVVLSFFLLVNLFLQSARMTAAYKKEKSEKESGKLKQK